MEQPFLLFEEWKFSQWYSFSQFRHTPERLFWLIYHVIYYLLTFCVFLESNTFDSPCQYGSNIRSKIPKISRKPYRSRSSMSDLIRLSVNYKVDPCDNFYEFACGNWIAKHPEDVLPWDEVKKFARLEKSFQDDMRGRG
ncbi:unnamed protein product [Heligmosomoides polygyrus]|uniref:Peptidase_M13_N domain-containing protein n=1 Tax=Heligmosomoides polygyrus TaxID=6339 RepID=A0A183FGX5_HELPZ|nr:unnamed protein product [Heligmosomoides polygyrus]